MVELIMGNRIGVWGYGSVGKSFVRFLRAQGYADTIHLFDDRLLLPDIITSLVEHNVQVYMPEDKKRFLSAIDVLLPSPGVALEAEVRQDLHVYNEYDVFCSQWRGKIIAITGTIGKTTVTSLITHMLHTASSSVRMGGNIGIPMLDLLPHHDASMTAVIELSSFQLEYGIAKGPDLAIITNCYPNHLDRHKHFDVYKAAKMNLICAQTEGQHALVPYALRGDDMLLSHKEQCSLFIEDIHDVDNREMIRDTQRTLFWRDNNHIFKMRDGDSIKIAEVPPTLSFAENWLIAYAALDLLGYAAPDIKTDMKLPEHRLTYISTKRGITFFNDSKATVPQATDAALKKIVQEHQRLPVLFLGGCSKGVDRQGFIYGLTGRVRHVIFFGREAEQLQSWANDARIPSHAEATLEGAFLMYTKTIAQYGDIVLFSPSGSSYDLFHDFQERGNCFVQLVHGFAND